MRTVLGMLVGFFVNGALWADSDFDFWISKELLADIDAQGPVYTARNMTLTAASKVHSLGDDCEAHIAASPPTTTASAPHMYVIEPANLCKNKPPSDRNWGNYIEKQLLGNTCNVTGFPRIFDEHLYGSETETNPHHMLEIHPALLIECEGATLDATTFLRHHPGMREMQPSSAQKCLQMEVRIRDNAAEDRWEFQVDRHPHCGNFASFKTSVFSEWIRQLKRGEDGHSALARVTQFDSAESVTLKIYTLPGTAEDAQLEEWRLSGQPHHGGWFHGMTTIDYFAVIKTIEDPDGSPRDVSDWTDVSFPLALVVYGTVESHDDEVDPFHD